VEQCIERLERLKTTAYETKNVELEEFFKNLQVLLAMLNNQLNVLDDENENPMKKEDTL